MTPGPLETPIETASDAEQAADEYVNKSDDARPVVVYTAVSEQDGEIVRGILESEGVPAILTNAASSPMGDVFSIGEGQAGEILVAPSDVERANLILEETSRS